MRSSLAWLRERYAESEGHATPVYGVVAALGIAVPLIVGTLTGHAAEGGLAALGAFYVANTAPEGPYGARARALLATILVITVFTWLGGALNGHGWLAVLFVPAIAAVGAAIPWMGATATWCTVVATIRPPNSPVLFNGFMEALGGLFVSAMMAAPWLTHRLRPLRLALAESARAVADALDLLAAPEPSAEEWDRHRRQAYDAIRNARATYGLYRSSGRDEQKRPKRLIDLFGRAMDEVVALHELLDVVRREDPPEEWERARRMTVAALAARLRLLSHGTTTDDSAVLGGDGAVVLDRFGRITEEVRQEWLGDRGDLLGSALILQVRHLSMRLGATIDGARKIVARGLRLGFDPPRLPVRTDGGLARVKDAIVTRSPGFQHSVRVGAAIAVAMAAATGLKLPYGHWLTIAVVVSLRDTYGDTISRVVKRVGGTAVGAIAAALVLALVPGERTLITLIFAGAALGFTFRAVNHAYWMAFATPMIMLLVDYSSPLSWTVAAWRIGLTIAGGALATLASRLLWPGTLADRPAERTVRLLRTHARLARTVSALLGGDADAPVRRRIEEAAAAANDLDADATRLAHEPVPSEDLVHRLRETTAVAQRLRDDIRILQVMGEDDPVDVGLIPAILERIADHLEESADALLSRVGTAADLDLREQLGAFDEHLAELARRRRTEMEGIGIEPVTTLRRSLMQMAAVRHALHTLAADTERLHAVVVLGEPVE